MSTEPPLVLDLDGTLIRTDTFHEMLVRLLHQNPWLFLHVPFWFLKGRAYAKARLVKHTDLCPTELPYNKQLLDYVTKELNKGRSLILATGSDQRIAKKVADHLGFFQEVIASDGHVNMTGPHKCKALLDRFGIQGFDYAGDSRIDGHVWEKARKALVIYPKQGVLKVAQDLKEESHIYHMPRPEHRYISLLLALRAPFWLLPLTFGMGAFVISLNALASGIFITNDILTLMRDRTLDKRKSIFAEGMLHLSTALYLSPLLFLVGALAWSVALPSHPLLIISYGLCFGLLDLFSRTLTLWLRWSILGLFQLLSLQGFHLLLS